MDSAASPHGPQAQRLLPPFAWEASLAPSGALCSVDTEILARIAWILSNMDILGSDDIELANWVNDNVLNGPCTEIELEIRRRFIYSPKTMRKVHSMYQRAQILTNNAIRDDTPFCHLAGHKMSMAVAELGFIGTEEDEAGRTGLPSDESVAISDSSCRLNKMSDTGYGPSDERSASIVDTTDKTSRLSAEALPPKDTVEPKTESPLLTAAHSDPVITNLDARPITPPKNKRKSEDSSEQSNESGRTSQAKGRGRGRGVGSRRRGATRYAAHNAQEGEEMASDVGPAQTVPESSSIPQGKRRGAMHSSPASAAPPASNRVLRSMAAAPAKAVVENTDLPERENESAVPSPSPVDSDDHLAASAIRRSMNLQSRTPPATVVTQAAGSPFVASSEDDKKPKFATPVTQPSNGDTHGPNGDIHDGNIHRPSSEVNFFARVQTTAGTIEVPLQPSSFVGDAHLLKRYVEFKQQENEPDLSFEQFVTVCGFAK